MHVIVIGAGVVGVTSAWYLAQAGCRVTLLERNSGVALETSYANVGQVSPALSAPWSSPGIVSKTLMGFFSPFSPFVLSRLPDAEMGKWLWRFLSNCNASTYSQNKRRMVGLAEYSRDCLRVLRTETNIHYCGRQAGTLIVFRTAAQQAAYDNDLAILAKLDVAFRSLAAHELAALEPNLDIKGNGLVGGVLLPNDETGDCHLFTRTLASQAAERGVSFHFGEAVSELIAEGGRIKAVRTSGGDYEADAVVVAGGVESARLLRPLGVSVPIYPVKGYSITIDSDSDAVGPISTVSDDHFKVGVTNLGDRIRVGGTAELAGYDLSRPERRYQGLYHVVGKLFPSIPQAQIDRAERWSGLRPMTPDGMPRTLRVGADNLYVNAGHGTLGWTMACGSARILADTITGRKPEVGLE